ncbi:MAG: hypothetical protein NC124_20275 [Clostridium sp.]|nr:hypothetical protein [Clostridium sp.]
MSEKYNESCMKFSNQELKRYLIDNIKSVKSNLDIRLISEDGEEVAVHSHKKIETIVFDGKDENLFINFFGVHTSIFIFDHEIMFIDENSKGTYTSSDVYHNVVYEGNMREMTHAQMLQMFAEIILCLVDATDVCVVQSDVPENNHYKKYNYYEPHMFTIDVKNNHAIEKVNIYENITIKY